MNTGCFKQAFWKNYYRSKARITATIARIAATIASDRSKAKAEQTLPSQSNVTISPDSTTSQSITMAQLGAGRRLLLFESGTFSVSKWQKVMTDGNNKNFSKWKMPKLCLISLQNRCMHNEKQWTRLQSTIQRFPTGVHCCQLYSSLSFEFKKYWQN